MVLQTDVEPYRQPLTERAADPNPITPPWVLAGFAEKIAKDSADQPDIKRPELVAMEKWWRLGDVLLAGTDALKACADELLPPLGDDEKPEERDSRLRKAMNTPFYQDIIGRLVSKPFARPVSFRGATPKLPDGLEHLNFNADGEGRGLTVVLRDHLHEAIHRGGSCLLSTLPDQATPQSEAERLAQKPLIKRVSLRDIYGWSYRWEEPNTNEEKAEASRRGPRLITTMLRLREMKQKTVGMFGVEEVLGIRVLKATEEGKPGFSIRYERDREGNWIIVEKAEFRGTRIMLNPLWTWQLSATMGRSTMTPIAEMNLGYVQDDSEQRYGTSHARISTLYTIGAEDDRKTSAPLGKDFDPMALPQAKAPTRITRGHRRLIRVGDPNAKIGMLETNGSGLAAGRNELEAFEKRMERFGAANLATTGVTATGIRSDDDRDNNNLKAWVTREEINATDAVRDCAELNQSELPKDWSVELFRDWNEADERDGAMRESLNCYDRTLVPARVPLEQLRRYGALSPKDTPENLLKEAQAEKADRDAIDADNVITTALAEGAAQAAAAKAAAGDDPNADPAADPAASGGAGGGGKPGAKPTDEPPATFNELTLGAWRAQVGGNIEGANKLWQQAAELLGIPSLGKVTKKMPAPPKPARAATA